MNPVNANCVGFVRRLLRVRIEHHICKLVRTFVVHWNEHLSGPGDLPFWGCTAAHGRTVPGCLPVFDALTFIARRQSLRQLRGTAAGATTENKTMRAFVATLCIVAICGGCGGEMATQEKASSSPEEPTSAKSESVVEDTDAGDKKMDEPIVIDVRSQEEWDEGHICLLYTSDAADE